MRSATVCLILRNPQHGHSPDFLGFLSFLLAARQSFRLEIFSRFFVDSSFSSTCPLQKAATHPPIYLPFIYRCFWSRPKAKRGRDSALLA
mmetsp:Transcript_45802/g.90210  ORF Transcript_45802/g.90210 Transcript_45802/m.90210 type:complete len:90 (-) Transcript_45802:825-1094(-)